MATFADQQYTITVQKVFTDKEIEVAKTFFAQQLRAISVPINQRYAGPILGIAPLGGSKVTAFKELGLDGLLIVDWDRPGTPATIQRTFMDPNLQKKLREALTLAFNSGAMSSDVVMQVSVSAQLLARLWYELDVKSVRVQFYVPKAVAAQASGIQLWDGPPMGDTDFPLVTRFIFNYRNQPKELVYVSSKITADGVNWRNALPMEILKNLAPGKFHWGYLSADGLIFFSKKYDNGMIKGNQELLDLLAENAGIVLDYPYASYYTNCLPKNMFEGIASMCGRADLENWGLHMVKRLTNNKRVFGYIGLTPMDEVRVYVKSDKTITHRKEQKAIFSFTGLSQVGSAYEFKLIAAKESPSN